MPTIGQIFATEQVQWRSRQLTIALGSFQTEASYRTYLEAQALGAIHRHRTIVDTTTFRQQLSAWQQDVAAKVYDSGSPLWAASLQSGENCVQWFWLIVTQPSPDGKPSPNQDMTLAEMEECWKESSEKIIAAWQKVIQADKDDAADPTTSAATP